MSETESEYATSMTDQPVGETIPIGLGEERTAHSAVVVERDAHVPADDWPETGETVTFKAVNGHTEKEVVDIEKDREYPIQVGHGGWYKRSDFVEYTKVETHKVLELADGREIWASPEEADE